ncbi:NAD(P)-dependent oxidoreductase [Myxococcota bacterium]|nr:NAD(P)-dependent oxidoreductase [Myxococcota bacterium]MCZ7619836.1 NAD(P)-dependent oxidoreductase [Myxococcota bacterium]
MTKKTALITGGGGFIGCRLARRLAKAGYHVRGLDLSDAAASVYAAFGGELLAGDMLKGDDLSRATEGADLVVHTAAKMGIDDDWEGFRAVNVEGSDRVAAAARRGGASALVHFSSVMVYGFDFPDGATEDGALDGANNPYCQTKIESEQVVLRHHQRGAFDVYVIRPGDVYGPGCEPWVRTPVALMKAGLWTKLSDESALHNHVYVDNLIDGIMIVLASARSGEPFNVTDGARTPALTFFGHFERLLGRSLPAISAEKAIEMGQPRTWIRYLTRNTTYSIDKIRGLGYQPSIGLDEGMEITARWLRETGLVPELTPAMQALS